MSLIYYVPTRGRLDKPPSTLLGLKTAGLLRQTWIVCSESEQDAWAFKFPGVSVVAPDVKGIAEKRAWILRHSLAHGNYFLMLDDDLTFSHQYEDRHTEQAASDPARLRHYLHDHVLELFQRFDTVAIGSRFFCQSRDFLVFNRATTWAWGYETRKVYEDLKPAMNRLVIHQDWDWCLTLLKAGHKNVISSYVVVSSRPEAADSASGGVGLYRTPELRLEQGEKFRLLHSDVVSYQDPRPGDENRQWKRHKIAWRKAYRLKS